ncbi:37S ribosomal protein S4-like, mitochondrial [Sphaceloma murrayae]|uniref:Small ribosomal subunit protein uS4m n=1 Tax=Sphaceloma murrayae TaxID=2082308 RepID=A0A2K1QP44_9PEZI|nr:37S ribosomal protein S4-like, mitochondrial [Sphaceloma murrayae]
MTRKRFHNLKRPKIRQDWSRWTLYAINRMREPRHEYKTFFQQKWEAKSLTRAFHGNQIREKKWQLMFDRRLPAVMPMNAAQLAATDGSAMSAGRGSGQDDAMISDRDEWGQSKTPKRTPYMQMAYWPTERRLDTAVWRALFASSTLQARQFVVHGAVRVNGKKMRHPGYLLNPGDMFQVEPEKVMYATGARKYSKDSPESTQARRSGDEKESKTTAGDEEDGGDEDAEKTIDENDQEELDTEEVEPEAVEDPKKALRKLMTDAKGILANPKEKAKLSGKQKQAMRAFSRQVRTTMSKIRGDEVDGASASDTVEALQETLERLLGGESAAPKDDAAAEASDAAPAEAGDEQAETGESRIYPHRDARLIREALDLAQQNEGPADANKPYATPWQPREYMSAFAFIPRYLEVNHKICSAVYLRHPVARPGLAEVPSPYGEGVYQLAHNWYLRRR